MTCAKQTVTALLRTTGGRWFIGTNWCRKPQKKCPRGDLPSGVGYYKCRDICQQTGHAEINVLAKAGLDTKGSTLVLIGHDHICHHCAVVMRKAGVARYVILNDPHEE